MAISDKNVEKKLEILLSAVDKVYPSYKQLMLRSFIQGVFVALGTTIGLSIVLAILTFVLHQLQNVPFFHSLILNLHLDTIIPKK